MKCVLKSVAALLASAATSGPNAVKIERNNADLEFTYEYPAQAAAIPTLDRRFRVEAAKEYQRHLKLGRIDKKSYRQEGRGSVTDFYSKVWSSAGETPRLLSLQYQHGTYTGGAHPNTGYGAMRGRYLASRSARPREGQWPSSPAIRARSAERSSMFERLPVRD